MTSEPIVLEGCAPTSLSGYLKALGAFRLVATQADENVRGWWENERFHLATALSREKLVAFLLQTYRPTPLVSPWNAGSGFYHREEKAKEKDPVTGKLAKTGIRNQPTEATRALDAVLASKAPRLEPYRQTIGRAKEELVALGFAAAPGDAAKAALIRALRSRLPDPAIDWIDAAATVTQVEVVFPPLLGSGGNDGNLDFSTTVVQRISDLINLDTGKPAETSPALLTASIFGEVAGTGGDVAISQFAPGAIGAPNSATGFNGRWTGNGWDIVLALEGALVMATALARRVQTNDEAASFPFMISRRGVFGAGAGSIALADENARGEFWAPVWGRRAAFSEILALFREGRAVVNRVTAGNALDFAQALGRLGVDRGIGHFQRYGFEQRNGNMYLGVPLDRRRVEANPHADLIADLTRGNWLGRVRSAVRGKGAPASLLTLGQQLDEALFRVTGDSSPQAVQNALQAIGALAIEAGRRPKLREGLLPPRLSHDWVDDGDDGSHAFAIARALASLDATAAPTGKVERFQMPFRRHLVPLKARDTVRGRDEWSDTTEAKALAIWTGRDPLRDMAAVLSRRLLESERRVFVRGKAGVEQTELPLRGWGVSLAAISAFLTGDLDAEIDRISALAAGLAWVDRNRRPPRVVEGIPSARATDGDAADDEAGEGNDVEQAEHTDDDEANSSTFHGEMAAPDRSHICGFAFAALKPLFDPKGVAVPRPWTRSNPQRYGEHDRRERKVINPLPLMRLIDAGRVNEAVMIAARVARGAGLSVPFAGVVDNPRSAGEPWSRDKTTKLAAALLVPLSDRAIEALANRAYPVTTLDQEEPV